LPLLGDAPFLVVNGDIFCDYDFAGIKPLTSGLLAWLILVNNPNHNTAGDFALHGTEVSDAGQEKLTFSGIGVYHPQLFADVKRGSKAKLAPLLRQVMLTHQVGGRHYQGRWLDIGTPERLAELDKTLKN
jgi:MurNAc alpha-1-phosphate uridylyltransferase